MNKYINCDGSTRSQKRVALFWTTHSAFAPVQAIERELILREKRSGTRVVGVYCAGQLQRCHGLRKPKREYMECALCNLQYRRTIEPMLDMQIDIPVTEYRCSVRSLLSQQELRAYRFDGSDVGAAVLSTLMTNHRDAEIDPRPLAHETGEFLASAIAVHRAFSALLDQIRPDRVYFFNGRQFDTRPLLRLCEQRSIDFTTYECALAENRFTQYHNSTPHSLATFKNKFRTAIPRLVASLDHTTVRQRVITKSTIYGRDEMGVPFRHHTDQGALPENFNPTRRNIAILHGSEDEYSAVDNSIQYWLGADFRTSLARILDGFEADANIHFYLRLHPRLSRFQSAEAERLLSIKDPRLTVVAPDSGVDTLNLAIACGVAICYGSTTGPEAVLLGVRVVCIADCWYSELGLMPDATNIETLEAYIKRPEAIVCQQDLAAAYLEFINTDGEPFQFQAADRTEFLTELLRGTQGLRNLFHRFSIPYVGMRLDYIVYQVTKAWAGIRIRLRRQRRHGSKGLTESH